MQVKVFDPNFHEAVITTETDKFESDTIIKVIRKGYVMGDKVIRPAQVEIAKEPSQKEKLKQLTTAIFYANTNNGYTKFENGLIVESVANRMVFFSADMKHTGTSCTDEKTRVVINFNYFK